MNRNFGLINAENVAERWEILESILQNGVQPQPQGRGKYSELPTAVFGVIDDPKSGAIRLFDGSVQWKLARRRYNEYAPWIVADVPSEEVIEPDKPYRHGGWALTDWRPGSVIVLPKIQLENIVAVNGLPVERFKRAYARFGRLGDR